MVLKTCRFEKLEAKSGAFESEERIALLFKNSYY